jgi:hypothetical protein
VKDRSEEGADTAAAAGVDATGAAVAAIMPMLRGLIAIAAFS